MEQHSDLNRVIETSPSQWHLMYLRNRQEKVD